MIDNLLMSCKNFSKQKPILYLTGFILLGFSLFFYTFYVFISEGNQVILAVALISSVLLISLEKRVARNIGAYVESVVPLQKYGRFAYFIIIALVGFFICIPTINNYFLADDFGLIQLFHSKPFRHFLKLFFTALSEDIWGGVQDDLRPLFALSYKLNYYFFGVNPIGYHFTNIILHALNSLLIFLIVITLTNGRNWIAFVAGLLFAFSPVHSEPISWITGKVDSLPTFFYLSAFFFFILFRSTRLFRYYCLSIVSCALGLFSKEILITLPLMLISYDLFFKTRSEGKIPSRLIKSTMTYAPFFVLVLFYLYLRWIAFGTFVREEMLGIDILREFLIQQDYNLRYLLLPFNAMFEKRSLNFHDRFTIVLAGVTLSIFFTWTFFLLRNWSKYSETIAYILYFGLVWYLISIAPLVVTYFSPRHLYFTSSGTYIAIAFLIFPFSPKQPTKITLVRLATIVFLIILYGYTLVKDNSYWVEAGAISQKARVDIEKLAETIPKGSTVIIPNIPAGYGTAHVWRWALPFALQKPFTSQDFYSNFNIIEHPLLDCCPVEVWWEKRKQVINSLLSGSTDNYIDLYILQWDDLKASVILRKVRIRREYFKAQVEHILYNPKANTESIDYESANRLIEALTKLNETN